MRLFRRISGAAALLLGAHTAALAITYNCANFSIPGGTTHSTGINNAGVIVGTFTQSSASTSVATQHGFIRDASGNITLVDYPGAISTQLFKINNNGLITGTAFTGAVAPLNFTVDLNGNFQTISLPAPYNQPSLHIAISGINDSGYISGWEDLDDNFFILAPDGTVTLAGPPPPSIIATPGAIQPSALNNSLEMLEPSVTPVFYFTGLYQPGQGVTPIASTYPAPPQNAANLLASGLNNTGAIVGFQSDYHAGGRPFVPFLRDPSGVFSEIVCPATPHFAILPYAINDSGVMTGDNTSQLDQSLSSAQSFIATPLPGLAQFTPSASSLGFAPQTSFTTGPGQTVTITNTGTARMDIGSMEFYGYPGEAPSEFTVSGCVDPSTGYTSLNPGASCVITVSLSPTGPQTGNVTDRLIIDDDTQGSPDIIAVSGQVLPQPVPPTCAVSGYSAGPPRQVSLTMEDSVLGIDSIALGSATNVFATIPAFAPGVTSPIVATVTQIDPTQDSTGTLSATNPAGLNGGCRVSIASSANQWSGLASPVAGKIAVVLDEQGLLEAFARGPDDSLWHAAQTNNLIGGGNITIADGAWSAWTSLGGVITSDPAVSVSDVSGLAVFAVGTDAAVWEIAQPNSPGQSMAWSGWTSLGGVAAGNPGVGVSGMLPNVFVRGPDLTLWDNYLLNPPSGPWSGWKPLGGYLITNPVTATTQDEEVEVFALGGDGALWQNAGTSVVNETSSVWNRVGGGPFTGSPSVVLDQAGVLEVFARGADNALWHNVQSPDNSLTWTGWTSLGGYMTSDPAAAVNQDGKVEVFGRGGDNALWHIAQTSPGGPWSGWTSLGGVLGGSITALADSDGRLEVFALAPDKTFWHIAQVFPGAWQ